MEKNTMTNMMISDYGDEKMSKQQELNASMSVQSKEPDELEKTLKNLTTKGE